VDHLKNERREASRQFKDIKRKYLKGKINEIVTNSKNKNIRYLYREISKFKKGYQHRNNLMKEENGHLLAVSHNILSRCKNYFPHLLNLYTANDIRLI
jgi:hypothetical protein